ncbi:MAG: hypothetical protein QOE36_3393 [Gaiellaceae bacterium]|nr:hypothetical protein [Gaiellaceae bacterium]
MWSHLKTAVVAAIIGAVAATGTVAFAGSGIGGVFNLGQSNYVNHESLLAGSTAADQLDVANLNTGSSAKALGLLGKSPTAAAGVVSNTGGGPALGLTVNSGKTPFTVNSATRVTNLNADKLDGIDSRSFAQTYPGMPSNAAGTAKTLLGSNAVSLGSTGGLITVPGVAHFDASCITNMAYLTFTADAPGTLFSDGTSGGSPTFAVFQPGESGQLVVALNGAGRLTVHWFVGTPGAQSGQTLVSMTVFAYSGSPCVFTATAVVQSNA